MAKASVSMRLYRPRRAVASKCRYETAKSLDSMYVSPDIPTLDFADLKPDLPCRVRYLRRIACESRLISLA